MNNIQLGLFDYQIGDKVLSAQTDGTKKAGTIKDIFLVEIENHWYNGDDPLPVGETIYEIQYNTHCYGYGCNQNLSPIK